jgi:hypothetical protein
MSIFDKPPFSIRQGCPDTRCLLTICLIPCSHSAKSLFSWNYFPVRENLFRCSVGQGIWVQRVGVADKPAPTTAGNPKLACYFRCFLKARITPIAVTQIAWWEVASSEMPRLRGRAALKSPLALPRGIEPLFQP